MTRAPPSLITLVVRRIAVENAVRHTPRGAAIRVEAGPGAVFSVVDDGGHLRTTSPGDDGISGRQSLGLKIVGRIADIHGARFDWMLRPRRRRDGEDRLRPGAGDVNSL